MKFLKNQKGFTLVEILVVIAIIAILFITLLPQIDNAVDRARQTGVKTDFRSFQLASETYLRETNGKSMKLVEYNSYLDVGLQGEAVGPDVFSKEKDSWDMKYDMALYATEKMIVITSAGANEGFDDTGKKADNFILATYHIDGTVASCTEGFGANNITSNVIKAVVSNTWKCGQSLDENTLSTKIVQ